VCQGPQASEETAARALDALDRAWQAVVGVVGAPAPQGPDGQRWQVYLVGAARDGAALAGLDARSRFDRGASFGLLDATLLPGCALDHAAARAVARASLLRAVPMTDVPSATAQSESIASLASPCAAIEDADRRAFQSTPERAVTDGGSSASYERGASMFYEWLDARFSAAPGALLIGSWALSPTRTADRTSSAGRPAENPSTFDVLRVSLANALWTGSTLDDVFSAFAVARAVPPLAPPSPSAAWTIAWPVHARRLASPSPVAPTGSSTIVVDHEGAARGARLRIEAQWEDYARMRWTAVKVDAEGNALQSIPVRAPDRATHASITLEDLDGVHRVVVIGANVGSTERPFRQGRSEWEPHGWTLTLGAE
jgi:hypothetical protein